MKKTWANLNSNPNPKPKLKRLRNSKRITSVDLKIFFETGNVSPLDAILRSYSNCQTCHWFVFVDSCTYVFVENLPIKLSNFDPNNLIVFGHPPSMFSKISENTSQNSNEKKILIEFNGGFVISQGMARSIFDSAEKFDKMAKKFDFEAAIEKFLQISIKNLEGLNPSHPDEIVEKLLAGDTTIGQCCLGNSPTDPNYFALPLTYGKIVPQHLLYDYC